MKIKKYREKKKLSQEEFAKRLEEHAAKLNPDNKKTLPQNTLSSWENGVLPRKYWLKVISLFTHHEVTASDFVRD